MSGAINPHVAVRLRERAREDQYHAALRDFLHSDDAERRRHVVLLLIGHPPSTDELAGYEALRAEYLHARDADLRAGEIARVTGLSPATLRGMAERGEMPAPRYRGRWWWWNRQEIAEWLAQRQSREP